MPVDNDEVRCRELLEQQRPGCVLLTVAELPGDDVLAVVSGQCADAIEVSSIQHEVAVLLTGGSSVGRICQHQWVLRWNVDLADPVSLTESLPAAQRW